LCGSDGIERREHEPDGPQPEMVGHRPEEAFTSEQEPGSDRRGQDVAEDHCRTQSDHRTAEDAGRMDDDLGDQEQPDDLAGGQSAVAQQTADDENCRENGGDHSTRRNFPTAETVSGDRQGETGG